jgi:hypothetical protein
MPGSFLSIFDRPLQRHNKLPSKLQRGLILCCVEKSPAIEKFTHHFSQFLEGQPVSEQRNDIEPQHRHR